MHAPLTQPQVYELDGPEVKLIKEVEKPSSFKCGTFGASSLVDRRLATGNFAGQLQIWDLENPGKPVFEVQAHASIVNAVDGCGGQAKGFGAPELVTCGRDGCVRVWDVRQGDAPVAAFEPADSSNVRDCWCVAFGNSYNDEERCVLAGYDNGDVKMFDLRMNKVWSLGFRVRPMRGTRYEGMPHTGLPRAPAAAQARSHLVRCCPTWDARCITQQAPLFRRSGGRPT